MTAMEWLTTVAILAVVAAAVVPRFRSTCCGGGPRCAARAELAMLEAALDAFERDCGRPPSADEGLAALVSRPPGLDRWNGPYVRRVTYDPWGTPYVYQLTTRPTRPGVVWSAGPDGREYTGDDVVLP
jgi:general secretion pathway protein G